MVDSPSIKTLDGKQYQGWMVEQAILEEEVYDTRVGRPPVVYLLDRSQYISLFQEMSSRCQYTTVFLGHLYLGHRRCIEVIPGVYATHVPDEAADGDPVSRDPDR